MNNSTNAVFPNNFISEWLESVRTFTARYKLAEGFSIQHQIEPPLPESRLAALTSELAVRLPEAVRLFLTRGSRRCRLEYQWEPTGSASELLEEILDQAYVSGGADLCDASALVAQLKECHEWARETWIAEYPKDQEFWLNSLPISPLDNGDFLAVDLREAKADPPVVYLAHDDESRIIAPSFSAFLKTWADLCYIGPEIWILDHFIDNSTGMLDASTPKAERLRDVFRSAEQKGTS